MEEHGNKKRGRDDSDEFELAMPEVKKMREDLLDLLEDSDPDPVVQDLDSVMKSFEKEISASSSPLTGVNQTPDSGESQPDLGYLLEASDDELGLPPSSINSTGDEVRAENIELLRFDSGDSAGVGEMWGFEAEVPSFDSFGLGVTEAYNSNYVAYDDGLFDYSNICFDPSEVSDYSWRFGFTPAE